MTKYTKCNEALIYSQRFFNDKGQTQQVLFFPQWCQSCRDKIFGHVLKGGKYGRLVK